MKYLLFFLLGLMGLFVLQFQENKLVKDTANFTTQGWVLVIDKGEIYSKRQLELLGPLKSVLTIWDINKDKKKVNHFKIKKIPTWFNYNTRKQHYGLKDIDTLSELMTK